MNLSNFPHAVATAQQKLLNLGRDITIVRNALLLEENSIDQAIAFSSDFKNDSQRKTAKQQEQDLQLDGQELDSWLMERHSR
jgi:hypothetical protein